MAALHAPPVTTYPLAIVTLVRVDVQFAAACPLALFAHLDTTSISVLVILLAQAELWLPISLA